VLKEGAWADMLLINGDPTKDINLVADPQRNFLLIIKNGSIYILPRNFCITETGSLALIR